MNGKCGVLVGENPKGNSFREKVNVSEDIVIEDSHGRLGSITIVRDLKHLHVVRMASGFELRLPLILTLRVRPQNEPMLMIDNLRGHVFAKNHDGSLVGVGTLIGERQTAGISNREPTTILLRAT